VRETHDTDPTMFYAICYFAPGGGIAISLSVSLSVCHLVCLSDRIPVSQNRMSKLHEIFCTLLVPEPVDWSPLATTQLCYVLAFSDNGAYGIRDGHGSILVDPTRQQMDPTQLNP